MYLLNFLYRAYKKLLSKVQINLSQQLTLLLLYVNHVRFGSNFVSNGLPIIHKHTTGKMTIGNNCKINNTVSANPIGRSNKCMFVIRENAHLKIGDNVGMSGTTIVCQQEIVIGDYVKIGGNVCIYDTDFHALDTLSRSNPSEDSKSTSRKRIQIENHVFIGAHSTILKGVAIGENSIIGACSVVTKNIPANQIWAGNPATFIREIK